MACELYFNKAVRENIMIRQLFTYLHASNLTAKHIPQAGTYICVYYYYYFLKRADEKKATPLRLSDSLCLNFERLDYTAGVSAGPARRPSVPCLTFTRTHTTFLFSLYVAFLPQLNPVTSVAHIFQLPFLFLSIHSKFVSDRSLTFMSQLCSHRQVS